MSYLRHRENKQNVYVLNIDKMMKEMRMLLINRGMKWLEWVATSFSRGSLQPRDRNCISCISCTCRWILDHWTTWETHQ